MIFQNVYMKADPISFILEKHKKLNKKIFFISGNEITLMEKIKETILENIHKHMLEKIKNVSQLKNDLSLFGNKKVYLITDLSGVNNSLLDLLSIKEEIFIFFCENSSKVNSVKKLFINREDSFVFDCYEINKAAKVKILNKFLNNNNIRLVENIYWKLIEKLDDRYMLVEKELEKIALIKNDNIDQKLIIDLVPNNSSKIENVFFNVLNSNKKIIDTYNNKISSDADVNFLYYVFKRYALLIISSQDKDEFEKKIPIYLYKEKGMLIEIYNKYNFNKKKLLINLLYKTEIALRRSGELSFVLGLRFVLSFKKLTIS